MVEFCDTFLDKSYSAPKKATYIDMFWSGKHNPDEGLSMGVLYTCGFLGNAMGLAIVGSFLDEQAIFYGFTMAMILCEVLGLVGLVLSVTIKLKQN